MKRLFLTSSLVSLALAGVAFEAATEGKGSPVPRTPSAENQARLDHILKRTAEEPGVTSPTLARELNISTLQCSQLTDRLVKRGELLIIKIAGGVRTNYLPGEDYEAGLIAAAEAKLKADAEAEAKALEKAEAKARKAQEKLEAEAAAAAEAAAEAAATEAAADDEADLT